jgi:cobalt-precorrin 5A hydrolase
MKLAIIAVTNNGAILAQRLAKVLDTQSDIFVKAGRNPLGVGQVYQSLRLLIADIFGQYNGLVFIMATGIVVRVIAPYIQDKRVDPAVVVMDDAGEYVISLLSGHIGGANELTEVISEAIGAKPVITTATDVAHKPAPDVLAVKLDLEIEPFSQLKHINAAVANGDNVVYFLDGLLYNQARFRKIAAAMQIKLHDLADLSVIADYDAAVLITNQVMTVAKPHLYLRPVPLAVGIGCRRGASSTAILAALHDACKKIGRSMDSVVTLGSTVVKQDEIGLLAAAEQLAVPLEFFTNEQLEQCIVNNELEISNFVREQIGVGNVCEAAALLVGRTNKLMVPKTKYKQVTVAIAVAK